MQMSEKASVTRTWIRVGAFAGLLATIVYPVLLLPWSPPMQIVVVLALSFGLLFSTAAFGGYKIPVGAIVQGPVDGDFHQLFTPRIHQIWRCFWRGPCW